MEDETIGFWARVDLQQGYVDKSVHDFVHYGDLCPGLLFLIFFT